jgi:SAM-dependent methyltransferase
MIGRGASRAAWRKTAVILLVALSQLARAAEQHPLADVPYVPTPPGVVNAMLEIAGVGPEDYVIDLGSGDGRIVIAAAKQRGARGFGVEIDDYLVDIARREAQRAGVAGRVEFRVQDLFSTAIDRATVVTMYLFPWLMVKLRPRLLAELKPGTRVVSHDFDMAGWRPDAQLAVVVPDKPIGVPTSQVYLWIVPANAAGAWRWSSAEGAGDVEYELSLRQTFQALDGSAVVGGRPVRVESGSMRGNEIHLMLVDEIGNPTLRREFRGRVDGDAIRGKASLPGGGERDWNATRISRGSIRLQ